MAKRSRTRPTSAAAAPSTTAPVSSRRTARRRPVRRAHEPTFIERYGSLLLGALVLGGVLLIGYVVFVQGTQPAYACQAQLTPGPTEPNPTPRPSPSPSPTASPSPSPAPSTPPPSGSPLTPTGSPSSTDNDVPSPSASASAEPSASPSATPVPTPAPQPTARLGFTTTDMGRSHVARGTAITYGFCPPTSGEHFSDAGAPMKAAVYPPGTEQVPGNWLHNLEHGYIMVAYRCPSGQIGVGDCITQAELDQIQQWFDEAPAPTKSQCATKVLAVRYDKMSTRFAVLAWDRALLINEFDVQVALTFAQQWMEYDAVPEPSVC